MKEALTRLLTSAKFWTMIIGLIVTLGARYGFQVDPEVMWMIAGIVAILLGAQGLTDMGKSAALITTAKVPAEPAQVDPPTNEVVVDVPLKDNI